MRQAYRLKEWLPHVQLHILPQVGRSLHEEAPEEVNKIIIAFLAGSLNN